MAEITSLVGVYAADGTLSGEVAYWVGARLGLRSCSLCKITHGSVREKSEWKECRASLAVPFETFHRNDQPDWVRTAAADVTPIVVAATIDGPVVLLTPEQIDACHSSVDELVNALTTAAAALGLTFPA